MLISKEKEVGSDKSNFQYKGTEYQRTQVYRGNINIDEESQSPHHRNSRDSNILHSVVGRTARQKTS